jgi:peroxiredoxin
MVAPNFTLNRTPQSGGGQFTLSNYSGKAVYLNFFGYTCSLCIANGWVSEEIYDTYSSDSNFVTAGIDVWNGPATLVESHFRAQSGVSYQLLTNGRTTGYAYDMENGGSNATDNEARGHLIIDPQGIIRYYVPYDTLFNNPNFHMQQMLDVIACLLSPPPQPPQDVTIYPLGSDRYHLRWSPVPCTENYSIVGSFLGDFTDQFWVGESQTSEFTIEILADTFAFFRVEASRDLLTSPPRHDKKAGG